jgi:type I restriction enzyme S subunit
VSLVPVPYEWKTIPLRYVCKLNPSVDFSGLEEDDELAFLPMDKIKNGYFIPNTDKFSKYASSYNAFEDGDILLAKVTPCFENGNIAVVENLGSGKGFGSSELFVIRPTNVDRKFLLYYFQSSAFKQQGEASMTGAGGLKRVSPDLLREHHLPFPEGVTQHLIADYLDRETAHIDALIADKEKMLALLEEKRAALISSAITRGLNPDALLKLSGLDWLGDIPAHWDVWKLKYVVSKIGSGVTPRGGAESYQSEGVPLFRSQNIHFDGLRMDDIVFIDSETHESMSNSKVLAGDVLINITGASIGRCFYIEEMQGEANVNQHVCIVRPSSQIETKFLYFSLWSDLGQHQIDLSQSGSGREGLNFESLGNFSVVIPPVNEQRAIIEHLETVGQKSAVLLMEIRNSIDCLKERRAALITAAVTGQIPLEEMTR